MASQRSSITPHRPAQRRLVYERILTKSGYVPKFIGVLLMLGGAAFVLRNITMLLAPGFASDFFLVAMFPAGVALTVWMLVKGVDVAKWEARAALARSHTH